ncbi:MAG: hypothetical protein C0409_05605, partial [Novosphingobium sp.]|nr:hypothetical protein [Novosphingobium sp.]
MPFWPARDDGAQIMAGSASARRGQPVLALAAIMVVWMAARAAMWNPVFETRAGTVALANHRAAPGRGAGTTGHPGASRLFWAGAARPSPVQAGTLPQAAGAGRALPALSQTAPSQTARFLPATASGTGPVVAMPPVSPADSALPQHAPVKDDPRWTFDRWLLMRAGSGDAAQAPGAASYGASQAGAIVRFRLGRGDAHESYGYLRTSLAINAPGKDKELALGFGTRPVRKVPLRLLAEARLYDSSQSSMRVRPVVTVITELPWQSLPA